jgi:hypothetical protein
MRGLTSPLVRTILSKGYGAKADGVKRALDTKPVSERYILVKYACQIQTRSTGVRRTLLFPRPSLKQHRALADSFNARTLRWQPPAEPPVHTGLHSSHRLQQPAGVPAAGETRGVCPQSGRFTVRAAAGGGQSAGGRHSPLPVSTVWRHGQRAIAAGGNAGYPLRGARNPRVSDHAYRMCLRRSVVPVNQDPLRGLPVVQ